MRKSIAIFFMSLMLLSTTQLYQVAKLPALISHYLQHRNNDGLSLVGFLYMHYGKVTEMDDDWQEDMKLPFKSSACNLAYTIDLFRPEHSFKITRLILPVPIKEIYAEPGYTLSNYHADIWQPPRHTV